MAEVNPDHEELLKELRGVQRIVINTCYGGFSLSRDATLKYLELAGIEYALVEQEDRERQLRLGDRIMVEGHEFSSRSIDRDDPALVSVVRQLGSKAGGEYAKLKIVEVPGGVEWGIEEYDGREWIAEVHRVWQ
jgi:hypothetical protein